MKNFLLTICLLIPTLHALPNNALSAPPCHGTPQTSAPDTTEKCKTNLDNTLPVHFEFPDAPPPSPQSGSPRHAAPPATPPPSQSEPPKNSHDLPKHPTPITCTYTAYAWNTKTQKPTAPFHVEKPYADLTSDERDPNYPQCSICQEDQSWINPEDFGLNLPRFQICHAFAAQVHTALKNIFKSNAFDIVKLEGYRPGKTRGKINANGLRSQWSQHSFGTALDINANHNAIYTNCPKKLTGNSQEIAHCKKGIGGPWNPEKYPRLSITKNNIVYLEMTKFWKWGGEIDGYTKDIMHFSPTGY